MSNLVATVCNNIFTIAKKIEDSIYSNEFNSSSTPIDEKIKQVRKSLQSSKNKALQIHQYDLKKQMAIHDLFDSFTNQLDQLLSTSKDSIIREDLSKIDISTFLQLRKPITTLTG
jgi:hypothetical protein